ncbi:hypothetical protein Zm00014a_042965 [Zea mays]|jgi:hypothetical protein|uniref:Uncharacterized protein n=2 Tax=Zea mays TaxID=4577 RepID=K7U3X0_MAIZE|nr:hypothetical protein ZEAMMB73_Zm00001d052716 [Zea mays]PWZ25109.1 hypothetical protein Zm00014a_042965 [Zea mays]
MVCLSFSSSGCQDAHPSALDYFLAALVMFTAVVAARLLASAVARCLCGDGVGAHHHHHHSPDATAGAVDEGVELPWGGAGLAIFGQPGMDVLPPRGNDEGWHWHWHGMALAPVAAGTERAGHVAQPSTQRQHLGS